MLHMLHLICSKLSRYLINILARGKFDIFDIFSIHWYVIILNPFSPAPSLPLPPKLNHLHQTGAAPHSARSSWPSSSAPWPRRCWAALLRPASWPLCCRQVWGQVASCHTEVTHLRPGCLTSPNTASSSPGPVSRSLSSLNILCRINIRPLCCAKQQQEVCNWTKYLKSFSYFCCSSSQKTDMRQVLAGGLVRAMLP